MKSVSKTIVSVGLTALLLLLDLQIVSEAQAVLGVRRRTAVRTAVVMESAETQQKVQQQSAAPASTPVGEVITTLPAGCTKAVVSGVQYYHCGSTYYRAAFQGSQLVYVSTQP